VSVSRGRSGYRHGQGSRGVQALDLSLALRAEVVLARVDLRSRALVADLGCATGMFSAMLAHRGVPVVCVDISTDNLAQLVRIHARLVADGRLHPLKGDLTALPLEDETVQAAFCMEVLEHIEDDRAALREIHRVLRRGGTLALSVPNSEATAPLVERLGLESIHDRPGPERHVRDGYRASELRELLVEAGLTPTWLGGVGGPIYRGLAGAVSLSHLAYRRLRGQRTWTWADVEPDAGAPVLRAYATVFPLLLAVARLDRVRPTRAATLVVTALKDVEAGR
jgi:SAM-dependent methyltransferase